MYNSNYYVDRLSNKPRRPLRGRGTRSLCERHGYFWNSEEEAHLRTNWILFKGDIHRIAIYHKRSFRSICLKLEQMKIVSTKFDREYIQNNNQIYFKEV